jgi:hypothetical protein
MLNFMDTYTSVLFYIYLCMRKLLLISTLFSTTLILGLCCGCNIPAKPVINSFSTDGDTTESDIRDQKPKFFDFTPVTYHLTNTGEDNYIRIISHSDDLQKAWMVYYAHNNKTWRTMTCMGKGIDQVISDTLFNTIFGVVDRSGSIEDPTFYMAFSKDGGKTWQNHPVEKAQIDCKANEAELLVSDDFDHKNGKPALVIILSMTGSPVYKTSKSLENWDNAYLCTKLPKPKVQK